MASDGGSSPWAFDDLGATYRAALQQCPASVALEDWEDACGEACLRVFRTVLLASVPPIEDRLAYLMRVAMNCLRRAQGSTREVQADMDLEKCEDRRAAEEGQDELAVREELWQKLRAGPHRWTKRQAELLALLRAGGCPTPSSLAAAMRCSRQRVLQILDGIAKKAKSPRAPKKKSAGHQRRRKSSD